jgi:hypothetical protein
MEITETKLSLADVLDHYGLKQARQDELSVHEDKAPSFQVYWGTNTSHCSVPVRPMARARMRLIYYV